MNHDIKIESVYYNQVLSGDKNFEIRLNDRGYQKGDTVTMFELDPDSLVRRLSGRAIEATISYVTGFNQSENWVVFGLKDVKEAVK